mgnify:CR=1 FL=1
MPRLIETCQTCNKEVRHVQQTLKLNNQEAYVYQCGHINFKRKLHTGGQVDPNDSNFANLNNDKLAYDFQKEGISFVEETNYNACIADAMGLGKTIQALLTIKRNKDQLLPCLIVVPGSLKYQWARQIYDWCDAKVLSVNPISSPATIIPGFDYYIISMDLLSRKTVADKLQTLGIKLLIIDEAHKFKNISTKRSQALVSIIRDCQITHKLLLTGTPIKNRANEYFMLLNLMAPAQFPSLRSFQLRWLEPNEKGRYTRVPAYLMPKFKRLISQWIIRREKRDVLTNLPPLTRDYQFIEITDPEVKRTYNREIDLFSNYLNSAGKFKVTDILGWLSRIRNLTGLAKCQAAVDHSIDFLDSTDEKLCIGIHHKGLRDTLHEVFTACGYDPLKFSGEDSPMRKNRVQQMFNNGEDRLLILNILAGGVGIDLQACSNALVLERQWNAADEEQFEGRFDRDGQVNPVTITYLIARGTIDEWFHNMVIAKRKIFHTHVGGEETDLTQDQNSLLELAKQVVSQKL